MESVEGFLLWIFWKSKICKKDKQLIFAVIVDSKIATVPAEYVVLKSSWKFQACSAKFTIFKFYALFSKNIVICFDL